MDIAKSLVKCVARAFYDTKHVLVLDALMIHNAVRDDELAKLLGLQTKDLHKLCGKLKEDRMLSVHSRPEQKEGQQRPVNRTYYYVDFRATIDAVKFRMHGIVKEVEKKMNKDADTKGYVCPKCNKRFSVLDAMSLANDDYGMFICDRCDSQLVDDDDSVEVRASQERLGRLMEQVRKIVDLLKKIDEVLVPPNDFETAITNSVPVPKDKNQLSAAQFVPVERGGKKNAAVPQATLEISITNSSEKSAAELAVEQTRRQQQAEKNALPIWVAQSTVNPGQITNAGYKEAQKRAERERNGLGVQAKQEEEAEKKAESANNGVQADAIAEYYKLLAQKEKEEAEEEGEEEDEDEDDEDEEVDFEDVANSAVASSAVTPSNMVKPPTAGESEEDEVGAPPGKRMKVESPAEDSEEEADFEDV